MAAVPKTHEPERVARRKRVTDLHSRGLSLRECARQVGVSQETVRTDLRDAGVSTNPKHLGVAARRLKVAALHKEGLAPGETARRLEVPAPLVHKDLAALGLKTRPPKRNPVKLPSDWTDIDQETTGLLLDAARHGSVQAAVTLQRVSAAKEKAKKEIDCESHISLALAGELLLQCASVYRDWIARIPDDNRLDGFKQLVKELVEDAFDAAHSQLTREFTMSDTGSKVLEAID